MHKTTGVWALSLALALTLAGCSVSSVPAPGALSPNNVNLIFVSSEDLTYNAPGDVNPSNANLTKQGLQRTLLMGSYLQQRVLGTKNVTGIYALQPMTHLQTANNYPDMAPLETIEQFSVLNQISLSWQGLPPITANSYPVNASVQQTVPSGAAPQGLDFNDQNGANEALVDGIITANAPGFYVFSAPWQTVSSLMSNVNQLKSYGLALPAAYQGPNYVYAISVAPSGAASLVSYNSNLNPPSTYPVLPVPHTTCANGQLDSQQYFTLTVTGGVGGAVVPAGINTNETTYWVRHAEAHPDLFFEDGNYVGAGQWRALDMPNTVQGISPQQVYSLDPAQVVPQGSATASGNSYWSYVRPSLTVLPYAIANNLPFNLVPNLQVSAQNSPQLASEYFFTGGNFSNQSVLIGWEHAHVPPTVNALIATYYPSGGAPTVPDWPALDYDTIWSVSLDASGNLSVDNGKCEGINSAALPATAPQF
jgi:hypothetical protein